MGAFDKDKAVITELYKDKFCILTDDFYKRLSGKAATRIIGCADENARTGSRYLYQYTLKRTVYFSLFYFSENIKFLTILVDETEHLFYNKFISGTSEVIRNLNHIKTAVN